MLKAQTLKFVRITFFNVMINLNYFDPNLLKIDKKLYKNIDM